MRFCSFIAATIMLSVSMAACADSLKIAGSGIEDTFNLPASPTVSASGSYGFSIDQVPIEENGMDVSRQIFFFSQNLGGGLLISSGAAGADVNAFGTQLYSGANDSPTFSLGTFSLAGFGTYTVTVKNDAPEPSSVLLLAIGLLAVGGLSKHRPNRRRCFSAGESIR